MLGDVVAVSALLDRLEQLEREATPRPWEADGANYVLLAKPAELERDAALIAECRNALPALLAVARSAEIVGRMVAAELPDWWDDAPEFLALRAALAALGADGRSADEGVSA